MNLARRLLSAFQKAPAEKSRTLAGGLDTPTDAVTAYGEGYLEAYEKVSTVYACMNRVATDMAAVPLVIEAKGAVKNGVPSWEKVNPGEGIFGEMARVFASANPEQGASLLRKQLHLQRLSSGNFYLLTDYLAGKLPLGATRPRTQTPRELWALRPDWMTVRIVRSRRDAFVYRVEGIETVYRPDEIVHYAEATPLSTFLGVPALAPATGDAKIESMLERFTLDALGRGNVRPFALKLPIVNGQAMKVEDDQIEQWESSWRSKFRDGFLVKVPFLKYGFEPVPLELMFSPEALLELARFHRDQIAMVYGVPPAILGRDVTDHNVEEQLPMYYENTLMPSGTLLEELLNESVPVRFGHEVGSCRFRHDWDKVPAVQRMIDKRATGLVQLAGGPVYTPDEARSRVNLPAVLGGNTLREQSTTVPGGPVMVQREAPPARAPRTVKLWTDTPERTIKRLAAEASVTRFDAAAEKMVRDYFTAQESRVLARASHAEKGVYVKDFDDVWDEDIEFEAARQLLIRIHTSVLRQRGPEAMAEVGADQSFLLDDPAVQDFLDRNSYEYGKLISGTTKDRLAVAIADASQAGDTALDLAQRIRDVFGVRRDQAQAIARTEVGRGYNFATFSGWVQSEVVVGKRWLTAGDDAVRESHRDLDNDVVPLYGTFANGLEYPNGPGPAEETIQCRCVLEPVLEGEDLKGLSITVAPSFARTFFGGGVDTGKVRTLPVRT